MAEPDPSPRLRWLSGNAARIIQLGERLGARRIAVVGSVARGEDGDHSDIDLYVWDFDPGDGTSLGRLHARRRADELVRLVRAMCPFEVDIRGIPGWLLSAEAEIAMRKDAVLLAELAHPHD